MSLSIKKDKTWLHVLVTLALMFGFGLLPPLGPITPMGMKVLGVFLGLLYGWNMAGFIWPSALGVVAFVLTDYMSVAQTLAAGFGSTTCVLLMFVFIFVAVVDEAGASRFIAMWFITRRAFVGKPWLLSLAFLLAAYILASTTTAVAIVLLCWGILYKMSETVGYQKGDAYPTFMTIAIVFTCVLGSVALPFRVNPLLLMGAYESASGLTVDYLHYILLSLPLSFICIVIFVLMGKWVFRVDAALLAQTDITALASPEELKLDMRQKIMLSALGAMVVLMLLPSFIPKTVAISAILTKMAPVGIVLALIVLICVVRVEGQPLFDFKAVAARSVQWETIMLCAIVLPVSSALTNESTGIQEALNLALSPIFGQAPPLVFMAMVLAVAAVLTNFANNVTVGIILIPVVYGFSSQLGANPTALVVLLSICAHFAFLTPVAAPPAAILFGNTEWVTGQEVVKYGLPVFGVCVLAMIFIGIPLGNWVF